MSLSGSYSLTPDSGSLSVYTYKEGMLSAVAHDLLLDATDFKVDLNVPDGDVNSAELSLEVQANSLKVVCAMKKGKRQPDTLKDKDKKEIEESMAKDVLRAAKFGSITFKSSSVRDNGGKYSVKGDLTLHGVTKSVGFDVESDGNTLKGLIPLYQKDYGIKPFKALMGTLKVKNEIKIEFELSV